MDVTTGYAHGFFCWADLASSHVAGAKLFYAGLFGWQCEDRPTDMGPVYTMLMIEGKTVAGLGPLSPDMQAQGMPSFWSGYIKSDDADATAARIGEAGGVVVMPPMDVMTEGRLMMAQDPTGALFGVWQPRDHIGAQLMNVPNTLFWTELQTRDAERAAAFYRHVFGWEAAQDESGYYVFALDGQRHAGMMQMDDSWGNVPPNWALYFMVENLDASLQKAQALGGRVLVPAMAAGSMGFFAVVQDPQGGVFTIMQMNPESAG